MASAGHEELHGLGDGSSLRQDQAHRQQMSAGTGVTRCTQYDERRGVSTGTGTSQRVKPRALAYPRNMSP